MKEVQALAAIEDCDGRCGSKPSNSGNRDHQCSDKGKQDMDLQTTAETHTKSSLPTTEAEMTKYGITRSTVDYFHYRDFKYTNLNDALAQAKRDVKELCG